MTKDELMKRVFALMTMDSLKRSVDKLIEEKPMHDGLNLLKTTLSSKDDAHHLWLVAFAILCGRKPKLSGRVIDAAVAGAGKPALDRMTKKELIEAIAAGSKLSKADAGRRAKPGDDRGEGLVTVRIDVRK